MSRHDLLINGTLVLLGFVAGRLSVGTAAVVIATFIALVLLVWTAGELIVQSLERRRIGELENMLTELEDPLFPVDGQAKA